MEVILRNKNIKYIKSVFLYKNKEVCYNIKLFFFLFFCFTLSGVDSVIVMTGQFESDPRAEDSWENILSENLKFEWCYSLRYHWCGQ